MGGNRAARTASLPSTTPPSSPVNRAASVLFPAPGSPAMPISTAHPPPAVAANGHPPRRADQTRNTTSPAASVVAPMAMNSGPVVA